MKRVLRQVLGESRGRAPCGRSARRPAARTVGPALGMRGFAALDARGRRRRHREGSRGRERGASGWSGSRATTTRVLGARADRKLPAPQSAIQRRACRCSGTAATFRRCARRKWTSASPTRPPKAARRSGRTCARMFSADRAALRSAESPAQLQHRPAVAPARAARARLERGSPTARISTSARERSTWARS